MDSNVSSSLKPGYPGPFLTVITMTEGVFFLKPTFIDIENAVRSKHVPVENIHYVFIKLK